MIRIKDAAIEPAGRSEAKQRPPAGSADMVWPRRGQRDARFPFRGLCVKRNHQRRSCYALLRLERQRVTARYGLAYRNAYGRPACAGQLGATRFMSTPQSAEGLSRAQEANRGRYPPSARGQAAALRGRTIITCISKRSFAANAHRLSINHINALRSVSR